MHRFFVPDVGRQEWVRLPAVEAHHALRVLRLTAGTPVVLLDGEGGEYSGTLDIPEKNQARVSVKSRVQHPPPAGELTLVQAIAKAPAMEGLVHRAVELGCRRLIPLRAERSVSRPDPAGEKRGKWESIAHEAAKQSGNPWRLHVEAPVTPRQWLARQEPFDLLLVASLLDAPCHPRIRFEEFQARQARALRSIALIIGPEGDFTESEYAAFRVAGGRSFSLGPHVLRVETAATAALAVVQSWLASLSCPAAAAPEDPGPSAVKKQARLHPAPTSTLGPTLSPPSIQLEP